MKKKSIRDIDVKGKRVFVRVDFNVPLEEGKITDDTRIRAALPTIKYLSEQGAKVILASHLGRPKGEANPKYSLDPVAVRLSELLGKNVEKTGDSIGDSVKERVNLLQDGDVVLLENVRFHKGEEKNDPELARQFAELADIYVNDAFGTAHRAHASTAGIAEHLPAVAGFLMEKEISIMGNALANPERPFTAIIGGAKVSDKITVIENLLTKVDRLIIGGGMANTFLAGLGYKLGKSLVEPDKLEDAKALVERAKEKGVDLLLPVDFVVASEFAANADHKDVDAKDVPNDWMALDIGPKTIVKYQEAIRSSKTVIWNGPMGVFEFDAFAKGTNEVAKAMADVQGTTIVGGGDSVAAIEKSGLADRMTHISTGGGASLEFLEGKTLPGIAALNERERTPIIAGNWKMFKTSAEAREFAQSVIEKLKDVSNVEKVVCAPFTSLAVLQEALTGTGIAVGAQNVHYEEEGAFTGEIAPRMLTELGVRYVIIGHSERRAYFNETDETVNKKVQAAIKHQLTPIICVGEDLTEREAGNTFAVVEKQTRAALEHVAAEQAANLVIAYEPIWAIGTGKSSTASDANEVIHHIRKVVADLYDSEIASRIRIQYGGSVKPENVSEYMAQPDIDGALVGGASLKPDSYVNLVNGAVVK